MKRLLSEVQEILADAALLEMGTGAIAPARVRGVERESIEENLIEVAFAEAADYDDIHKAILREHREERDIARPDDCGQGDNALCFV